MTSKECGQKLTQALVALVVDAKNYKDSALSRRVIYSAQRVDELLKENDKAHEEEMLAVLKEREAEIRAEYQAQRIWSRIKRLFKR